jgi:hypothetical protein
LHEPHNRYGGFLSKQIPPTESQSAFDLGFSGWDFFGKISSEIKTEFCLWPGEARWIANGNLAVHRIGGVVRVSEGDLRAFLAAQREG